MIRGREAGGKGGGRIRHRLLLRYECTSQQTFEVDFGGLREGCKWIRAGVAYTRNVQRFFFFLINLLPTKES